MYGRTYGRTDVRTKIEKPCVGRPLQGPEKKGVLSVFLFKRIILHLELASRTCFIIQGGWSELEGGRSTERSADLHIPNVNGTDRHTDRITDIATFRLNCSRVKSVQNLDSWLGRIII